MILKSLIIVHRYVGVVLGVIMTIWCLSGFVMMYQPYPATSPEERQAGLEPLDLSNCCADPADRRRHAARQCAHRDAGRRARPAHDRRRWPRDLRPRHRRPSSRPCPKSGIRTHRRDLGRRSTTSPGHVSDTRNHPQRPVVRAGRPPLAAALARRLRRSGRQLDLHQRQDRRSGAGRQRARALLELARRHPALALPDHPARERAALERGGDLVVGHRLLPRRHRHGDRLHPPARKVRRTGGRTATARCGCGTTSSARSPASSSSPGPSPAC